MGKRFSDTTNPTNFLNLSKEESMDLLDLRKDTLDLLLLDKESIQQRPARVAAVLDCSGSMSELYKNGTVQAVIEKLLPIAMKFDDNQEMEFWAFSNEFYRLPNITLRNYYGYVDKYIYKKIDMSGTSYAPVMHDIVRKYIFEDPADMPSLIMYITDGDNCDESDTVSELTASSYTPIFWQYIGISSRDTSFSFLKKLDEMKGRYVDNANFFELNDILEIRDKDLYERILGEYPSWLEYPEVKKMTENITKCQRDYQKSRKEHGKRILGFLEKLFDFIIDFFDICCTCNPL